MGAIRKESPHLDNLQRTTTRPHGAVPSLVGGRPSAALPQPLTKDNDMTTTHPADIALADLRDAMAAGDRYRIGQLLQWFDPNGTHSDEACAAEEFPPYDLEEALFNAQIILDDA
jgi:hypothetical protein